MFTRSGELREEYRHLEDQDGRPKEGVAESPQPPAPRPERERSAHPTSPLAAKPAAAPATRPPAAAGYPERGAAPGPGFMDLVGMLAEPASLYLQEAGASPPGTLAANAKADQNLQLARLHIDLLSVLQEKTAGNLDAREKAMLDDVVYRLQMGYVEMTR